MLSKLIIILFQVLVVKLIILLRDIYSSGGILINDSSLFEVLIKK